MTTIQAYATLLLVLLVPLKAAQEDTKPKFDASAAFLMGGTIAVGDVNGDGLPDIVSLGSEAATLLGDVHGGFKSGPISTQCAGSGQQLVDLNGDGKLDIVSGGGDLEVCLGNGDGTFQPAQFYPTNDYVPFFVIGVADFNGDHIPDVLIPGKTNLWLFLGNGDGTFQAATAVQSIPDASCLATGDFDESGSTDVILCTGDGLSMLPGNGDGTFRSPRRINSGTWDSVTIGDINGDGNADLIAMNGEVTNAYWLFLGDGKGAFSQPINLQLDGDGPITTGDVNGDGKLDLVNGSVSSTSLYVAFGDGKGHFGPQATYLVSAAVDLVLADLRGTGRLDIVSYGNYYSPGFVSVLQNEGRGDFEDGVSTPVVGPIECPTTADFNHDGNPDLAFGSGQSISVLLGTGNALTPFGTAPSVSAKYETCLTAGDFNNDGNPDLLVTMDYSDSTGSVELLPGNGDGTFGAPSEVAGPGVFVTAVLDFNHDGNLDWVSEQNGLYLGNGNGTFQTPVPFLPNCPMTCLYGIGDINNDGWPDVILLGDGITSLINNQHGGFTEVPNPVLIGETVTALAIGDLNGDGNPDLLVAGYFNAGSKFAAVLLGDGLGNFTAQHGFPLPSGAEAVSIADVNGDGIPDVEILLAGLDGEGGGAVAIYLGKGDALFEPAFYLSGSGAGLFLMNLHGQAPNSGTPDLVLPTYVGPVVSIINLTK